MSATLILAAAILVVVLAASLARIVPRTGRGAPMRRPVMRASTITAVLFGGLALFFVANLATLGMDYWTMRSGGSPVRAYREGDVGRLALFNLFWIAVFGAIFAAALFARLR